MNWETIESNMATLQPVDGGFTNAKRGIVTIPEADHAFVKIGTDEATRAWAHKEITVYKTLQNCGYQYTPQLLCTNADGTGFALEYLSTANGWEWETSWSKPRLAVTLKALDTLAELPSECFESSLLESEFENMESNPWLMPSLSKENQDALLQKLHVAGRTEIAEQFGELQSNFSFSAGPKKLVHYDVRRDNCAWNPQLQAVRLVDWNWLHYGSREIDINSLLVNVYKSGLDPRDEFSDRLDHDALMWLSGYWFAMSVQPNDGNLSDATALRSYQFDSAIAAYDLAKYVY